MRQANSSPAFVTGEPYQLIAFTYDSKCIFAAVVYIKNLVSGGVNFMMAKNRIVNRERELNCIPSLELQVINLKVEMFLDLREDLFGPKCLLPIKIL